MTQALCFHCGETKFGALCPCAACDAGSTGDIQLDIAFSDHHMSAETIKAFGRVIKAIRLACEEDDLRFWSFISFVSTHHSDILKVELGPEIRGRCADVLARANPPPVTVEEPEIRRWLREQKSNQEGDP